MQPLKGARVLDITRVLAGPLCTQTLAGFGADVIKVEAIGEGDEMRQWPPYRDGTGTAFLAYNRNKRGIALDLKRPEARAIMHRLAALSDVVVESGSTGSADRLGLGYAELKTLKPDLIYCSISGFGRTGPLRDAKGYDLMLQAFSGMMAMSGAPESGPTRSPFSPIDQVTGHHAVTGILAALLQRAQTGQGALVEVSLLETATHLLAYHLQAFWETGKQPERMGHGHPSLVPYQPFDAADKPILIGVANDSLWRAFCAEFGVMELTTDERFATNGERVKNRVETVQVVQDILSGFPADVLAARLLARGVPCSPLNTIADLSDHPQMAALGMFQTYQHPRSGPTKAIAMPITFDGARDRVNRPPPAIGEHTREILAFAGYDASAIEALLASGVAAAGCANASR
jgi:crotonobetainyl-CoA:carnitine CoA-transferase CaiB-like acyl-CoA transferase